VSIDHKAEALGIIAADNAWTIGYETADTQHLQNIAEAQVHATLYAAEQQRIANLIAYITGTYPNGSGISHGENADEIREGLGLE